MLDQTVFSKLTACACTRPADNPTSLHAVAAQPCSRGHSSSHPDAPLSPLFPPAGLHDEAFQLAEAAFAGTQLTRALERVFASLAAACVRAQMAWGRPAGAAAEGAAAVAAGGDDMETDESSAGGLAAAAAVAGGRDGSSAAAVADWRRLEDWLQRWAESVRLLKVTGQLEGSLHP